MSTGDPHTTAFKQNMDSLNYFLEDMNMPQELRLRAREYVRNGRELIKKSSYTQLLVGLSPDLRADIVLHMSSKTLEQVWYLGSLEQAARVELAMKLDRLGFAPREKVPCAKLQILMRGVAAKAGHILTYGSFWGEDIIVTSEALRDLRPASTLTYIEVAGLSRSHMDEVLASFPRSAAHVRQAAMRIAMRRAVIIISEYIRSRQDLTRASGVDVRLKEQHDNLTSAFGHSSAPSSDSAVILRLITKANLKDIVDGRLVEEVGEEEVDAPGASVATLLRAERAERSETRRELEAVRNDVAELKVMVRDMMVRMQGDQGHATARPPVDD